MNRNTIRILNRSTIRNRNRKLKLIDQDEAARSAGEGERSTERAREAGPPRREEGWAAEDRGQRVLDRIRIRIRIRVMVRVRVKNRNRMKARARIRVKRIVLRVRVQA